MTTRDTNASERFLRAEAIVRLRRDLSPSWIRLQIESKRRHEDDNIDASSMARVE
jgi:hypothetical protein